MATPAAKTGKGTVDTNRTVGSLAAEVDELRELIAQLTARLDQVSPDTAKKTEVVAATATVVAPVVKAPTKKGAPEDDPVAAMRAILIAAFELALEPIPHDLEEADEQFARFAALIHTNRRGTPLLEQSLRNYTWQQLRRNVTIYLDDDQAPGSFETTRITPDPITARTQQAKFFVRARTRMPTPITFKRDDAEGGAWRIEASSL